MGQPDPMLVTITVREIYDAVVRLTGRVDVLIAQQDDQKKRADDHEQRLRQLERRQWPLPVLAVVISIAGLVLALAKYIIIK